MRGGSSGHTPAQLPAPAHCARPQPLHQQPAEHLPRHAQVAAQLVEYPSKRDAKVALLMTGGGGVRSLPVHEKGRLGG